MQIFFKPGISGDEVMLDELESKHCIKVLRMVPGDRVQLVDGQGGFYTASVAVADPRRCRLKIETTEKEFGKSSINIHIAIAPTKNIERFEWFLEKATEIGISEITPLITEHSERKIIHPDRLEKILVSAIKQSLKAYLPKLNPLTGLHDFMANSFAGQKFIAHCYPSEKGFLKDLINKGSDTVVMIGPEGDFSEAEVELSKKSGFTEISLGQARLRTETAGVVACHTLNLINE